MSSELLKDLRTTTRQALSAATGDDIVDQLDLAGLLVADQDGGLGMGERELILVGEELGRAKASSSFLSTVVLAATLLKTPARQHYAVAVAGGDGAWPSIPTSVTATPDCGDWRASGTLWAVRGPSAPPVLLSAAATDDGVALFAIDLDDVAVTAAGELDPGRGLLVVALDDTKATCVLQPAEAGDVLATAYRRALLAVGAEQLGVARACLETTVEYAKTRNQFGAPIGTFQAIKHRCAEVLLDAELADAVLEQAVDSGSHADAELAFVVSSRAAVSAAESSIHVHGGIGFTWEHPAHWYLRRARVNATLLGGPGLHRAAIAESTGLTAREERSR